MDTYEVGKIIPKFRNHPQGALFNITSYGCILIYFYKDPTIQEKKQMKEGLKQYRAFVTSNIIFILTKFGNLPWHDSPYSVHLAKKPVELQEVEEGQGYACTNMLVDTRTGKIELLNLVSFSHMFSQDLKELVDKQKEMRFNETQFAMDMQIAMSKYSAEEMSKLCISGCGI